MTNSIVHNPSVHKARLTGLGIAFRNALGRLLFNKQQAIQSDGIVIDEIGDQQRVVQADRCIIGDAVETLTFNVAVNGIKWFDEERNLSGAIDISGTHIWTVAIDNVCQILMFSDALCTAQIGLLTLQEGTGVTCYDVGITTVNNNYNATLSDAVIRNEVIFEKTWNNWNNQNGYNLPALVYIPADSADLANDVLGNPLVNIGLVKFDADVVNMPAGNYDGVSSKIDTNIDLSGKQKVTLSAWFYKDDSAKTIAITQGDAVDERISLVWTSNQIFALVRDGSAAHGSIALGVGLYYIELIYDGSGVIETDKIKLRIDGVDQVLSITGVTPVLIPALVNKFTIGYESFLPRYSEGKIFGIGIWDNVKSYNETISKDQNNLIAYFPDGLYGYDVSGNNNHGTPTSVDDGGAGEQLYHIEFGYQRFGSDIDTLLNPDILVPYKLDGNKINPVIANYTLISEHPKIRPDRLYGNNLIGAIDFMPDMVSQLSDDLNTLENAISIKNETDAITDWNEFGLNGTGANVFESQSIVVDGQSESKYSFHTSSNDTPTNEARIWIDFSLAPFSCVNGDVCKLEIRARHDGVGSDWHIAVAPTNSIGSATFVLVQLDNTDLEFKTYQVQFVYDNLTTRFFGTRQVGGVNDGGVYVDNFSFQKISSLPLSDIGYKPFSIFNKLAYIGNGFLYPEFFEEEVTHDINFDPAFIGRWNSNNVFFDMLLYGNAEVRNSLLIAIKGESVESIFQGFENLGIYIDALSDAQMLKVSQRGNWESLYEILQAFHFNSQTELAIDLLRQEPFLDVSNNVVKILDWTVNRNHLVQGVIADRPVYNLNTSEKNIEFDGVSDTIIFTPISFLVNEDFRIIINKKEGTTNLMGNVIPNNDAIAHTNAQARIRINGVGYDFSDIGVSSVGEDCLLLIERNDNTITAKAILPSGSIIDDSSSYAISDAFEFSKLSSFDLVFSTSKQRQVIIQKAAQNTLNAVSNLLLIKLMGLEIVSEGFEVLQDSLNEDVIDSLDKIVTVPI